MKYMGSKRGMLANGLGHLIDREVATASRFIDLFAGSATVAWHAASRHSVQVLAFDLQHYSRVLAAAVVDRDSPLNSNDIWETWHKRALNRFSTVRDIPKFERLGRKQVHVARRWAAEQKNAITCAYGGHYFSPIQSAWIDCLLAELPKQRVHRTVALASLIDATSRAAAGPGHTAQPFQPTCGAIKYLEAAWKVDIPSNVANALRAVASLHAIQRGMSKVEDANKAAKRLRPGDLVFLDPPYSGVQYSRFYHVLETIARTACGEVSGVGRYPSPEERPRSLYSLKGQAFDALDDLLATIASRGARAIITFPDHECSNGLSGDLICDLSAEHFRVRTTRVDSDFSTLGGRSRSARKSGRGGRQYRSELILLLEPRD